MNAVKCKLTMALGTALLVSGAVRAAETTSAPAAAKKEPLRYQVHEVAGKARVAKIGVDPKSDAGWTLLKVGDFLTAGQQVRTTIGAKVKLIAIPSDPPTAILIESMTNVQISDLEFRGNNEAYSRIQIGYGAVRAGVAEGATKSNMEIATPACTLSKKGTDIFRIHFYSANDWGMSLSDQGRGLIQAIQNRNNMGTTGGFQGFQSRFVRPGQSVNQEMLRTIETEIFNRFVNVNDMYGLTKNDIKLISLWGNGLNIRGLEGNMIELRDATGRDLFQKEQKPDTMMNGVNNGTTLQLQQALEQIRINQRRVPRGNNAGDFGIGQGTVPVSVFNNANKAVQTMTLLNHATQKSAWAKSGGINRK